MARPDVIAHKGPRWTKTLNRADTLADDLGLIGTWVGPRTGPMKRNHGEKEDYVLRRLLVAWKLESVIPFPVQIRAARSRPGEPDFLLIWESDKTLGIEVTEAGEEDYQRWLTESERTVVSSAKDLPFDPSSNRTVDEWRRSIRAKVEKFDQGAYNAPDACDLLIYDNTSWGGFLDKQSLIAAATRSDEFTGRFRQIHIVCGGTVWLDIFGACRPVDVRNTYEIDYASWVYDQVEKLRSHQANKIDWENVAEELSSLGRSERRALASHLRTLMQHLLKWEFQATDRSASWETSIDLTRSEVDEQLSEMPSLRSQLPEIAASEYRRARRAAAKESALPVDTFPLELPYTLAQLVDPEFYPGTALGVAPKPKTRRAAPRRRTKS